jgi:hypothetical protein
MCVPCEAFCRTVAESDVGGGYSGLRRRGLVCIEALFVLWGCSLLGAAGRGCPACNSLIFASPKKSKQKKGDPGCCVPPLRYGQPAVLEPSGVKNNSPAAQTSFCPDPLVSALLVASTRGNRDREPNTQKIKKKNTNKDTPWRVLVVLVFGFLSSAVGYFSSPLPPLVDAPRSAEPSGSGQKLV